MKKLGLGFVLFALIATVALAASPDFSGKWVINKEKSNFRFGPDGPTPDVTMTIEQAADAIKVKTHMSTERGDFDRDFTLNPDGKTLTINSKMQGPMGEFESKRVMEKQ